MLTTVEELDIPQFKNNFDKASEFYWNNGFHIEENLFADEICDELIKDSKNFENFSNNTFVPEQQIHQKNNIPLKMMKNNILVDVIEKLISKNEEIFGIQSTFFYGIPGTSGSSKHQDGLWVQPEDANGFISAWTALDDLLEDNIGNLVVYESSHKDGRLEVREDDKKEVAFQIKGLVKYQSVMKKDYKEHVIKIRKGSTVLLHSNVVHGSIPNTSEKNRYALLLTYVKDGMGFREGREAKRTKTSLK
tara:strand:+ start:93 stop:836 length:744 start_codon:yes stop_codon:yes gene_type:complete